MMATSARRLLTWARTPGAGRFAIPRASGARALLSSPSPAPPATDEQIAELNAEIMELFGEPGAATPLSASSSAPQPQPTRRVDEDAAFERLTHSAAPTQLPLAHAGAYSAADKAAADATIGQLRERVGFLEKLVQQLIESGKR
jgi:hypothetical protein